MERHNESLDRYFALIILLISIVALLGLAQKKGKGDMSLGKHVIMSVKWVKWEYI